MYMTDEDWAIATRTPVRLRALAWGAQETEQEFGYLCARMQERSVAADVWLQIEHAAYEEFLEECEAADPGPTPYR